MSDGQVHITADTVVLVAGHDHEALEAHAEPAGRGSAPNALPLDTIVRLAEAAATELEAADAGQVTDRRVYVRSAALGLLLLGELGAVGFGSGDDGYHPIPPSVALGESEDIGGTMADGERRIAPCEDLLRRLGWERDRDYHHRACDQLGVVYTR